MALALCSALLLSATLGAAQGTFPADLVGTWSSKSNKTFTGPGFYNPIDDKFTEPVHTGVSYSFTDDGHFEEAYYRAISNPADPKCPKGIMQWQHGKATFHPSNGSLTLVPIAVDGRQLMSDPCLYEKSIYTRYNQTEMFERFEVRVDAYHGIPRLNLYQHDGSPMLPLYIAFKPPMMLPTTTLNPVVTATPGTANSKVRRSELPPKSSVITKRGPEPRRADQWWWFGVFLTASGSILYFFF
ncbi:hypothetical protein M011DRAFT_421269 [Sporormia fimetaria CBS 119925]|uniref:Protein ROT1 n=1 Tax=Sporormia fimetaria CBS 119925 TaxID=1340428 RepID=A0A6A6VH03_9PLEO|nr:hypothetical protein M011DRAFT_421269 [Sporormia fimetaria CBS 119925]